MALMASFQAKAATKPNAAEASVIIVWMTTRAYCARCNIGIPSTGVIDQVLIIGDSADG